jgi:membrane fusion protein (multidrug efflux system)
MLLRHFLVILVLAGLAGGLAWIKYGQIQRDIAMFSQPMPAPTVESASVALRRWEPTLDAVGSVAAVQGVEVSNQVAGQVKELRFDSGARVSAGEVLLVLDSDVDEADLEGLRAAERLATVKLQRNSSLLKGRAVSQGDFDESTAALDQARALVKAKQALIDKKTVRAPFDGQLGIRRVDLGQFLPEGTPFVLLQALDPVYVDFGLPERDLERVRVGQPVQVQVSAYPDESFSGSVSAIAPGLDKGTRSVQIRARFANAKGRLRPGMFARVQTILPAQERVMTLPRESIAFNTYGDSVFLIEEQGGKTLVRRRQVRTGAVRGDEVAIMDGLAAGDRVVVAGQVKLSNDQEVQIRPSSKAPAPPSASGKSPR